MYFFNEPPNPLEIVESIISSTTGSSAPVAAPKKMETFDVVLVTGPADGVGRRVVDILWTKGLPVRLLDMESEQYTEANTFTTDKDSSADPPKKS